MFDIKIPEIIIHGVMIPRIFIVLIVAYLIYVAILKVCWYISAKFEANKRQRKFAPKPKEMRVEDIIGKSKFKIGETRSQNRVNEDEERIRKIATETANAIFVELLESLKKASEPKPVPPPEPEPKKYPARIPDEELDDAFSFVPYSPHDQYSQFRPVTIDELNNLANVMKGKNVSEKEENTAIYTLKEIESTNLFEAMMKKMEGAKENLTATLSKDATRASQGDELLPDFAILHKADFMPLKRETN